MLQVGRQGLVPPLGNRGSLQILKNSQLAPDLSMNMVKDNNDGFNTAALDYPIVASQSRALFKASRANGSSKSIFEELNGPHEHGSEFDGSAVSTDLYKFKNLQRETYGTTGAKPKSTAVRGRTSPTKYVVKTTNL